MKRSSALRSLCGVAAATAMPGAALADDVPLRMGTINIDATAQPYYAEDGGFFKKAGLRVGIQPFNTGAAIAAGIAGGALDIGATSLVSLAQAHPKGVPFVILAPGALYLASSPGTVMAVPKASTLNGPRDLAGKTIGCNGVGGIQDYCIRAWLDKNGVDSSSAKIVELGFAQMQDALAAGRVDAAMVSEPFLGPAMTIARSIGAPLDACAPRFLVDVFIAMRDWAQANRDTVRRFQRANAEAAVWANRNTDKTAEILIKYTKLPESAARSMIRSPFAEKWVPAEAQAVIDMSAKYGNLPRFPIDEIVFKA